MTMFRVHAEGRVYDVIATDADEARAIAIKQGAMKIHKIKAKKPSNSLPNTPL
jgi:hypothetical protein